MCSKRTITANTVLWRKSWRESSLVRVLMAGFSLSEITVFTRPLCPCATASRRPAGVELEMLPRGREITSEIDSLSSSSSFFVLFPLRPQHPHLRRLYPASLTCCGHERLCAFGVDSRHRLFLVFVVLVPTPRSYSWSSEALLPRGRSSRLRGGAVKS